MTSLTTNNVTSLHPEVVDVVPVQPVTPTAQSTLWTTIQPWHEPVESEIFNEIEQVLKSHAHFSNTDDGFLLPFWVAHSNMLGAFEYTPRLWITAPFKASGKTEILKLLQLLCNNAVDGRAVTEAVFVRIGGDEDIAFFIDEGDLVFKFESSDMTRALNIGHEVGASFMRCTGNNHTGTLYPIRSAVAVAGIDLKSALSDTTWSRGIEIQMVKAKRGQITEKFRRRRHLPRLQTLASKLLRWCIDNRDACANYEPDYQDRLEDRDELNWTPLVSIASIASAELGRRMMNLAVSRCSSKEEADDDVLMRLIKDSMVVYKHLEDSLTSFKSNGMSIFGIQSTTMAHELNNMHLWRDDDDQCWSRYNSGNGGYERDLDIGIKPIQLSKLYSKIGIKKKSYKQADKTTFNCLGWTLIHKAYDDYVSTESAEVAGTQVPEFTGGQP